MPFVSLPLWPIVVLFIYLFCLQVSRRISTLGSDWQPTARETWLRRVLYALVALVASLHCFGAALSILFVMKRGLTNWVDEGSFYTVLVFATLVAVLPTLWRGARIIYIL